VSFHLGAASILASAWVGLFAYVGLYREWTARTSWDDVASTCRTVALGVIVLFLLTFDPDHPISMSRFVNLTYGVVLVLVAIVGRSVVRAIQRRLFARGHGGLNALIVGTGPRARQLRAAVNRTSRWGFRIAGHLGTGAAQTGDYPPVVAHVDDIRQAVKDHGVTEVMFAEPKLTHEAILNSVAQCNGLDIEFRIVPDLFEIVIGRSNLGQLVGMPLMPLFPDAMPIWQRRTKRLMDVVASLLLMIVGMPVWVATALAIWLGDRGPILYSQERVGHKGRAFTLHKYRSMVQNAEGSTGPVWAQKDDPRITRVGKFLRRTRLDEAPQMWNVLCGDMSLVGPRPERAFFVERLTADIKLYQRRLSVKPGVTGWAQTNLAYDASLDDVREKLKCDLYYIENMSLGFDLLIIARTAWVVFAGRGAL